MNSRESAVLLSKCFFDADNVTVFGVEQQASKFVACLFLHGCDVHGAELGDMSAWYCMRRNENSKRNLRRPIVSHSNPTLTGATSSIIAAFAITGNSSFFTTSIAQPLNLPLQCAYRIIEVISLS